ncbi:MAG TPA: type II toxin-antitoxin system VapC family toxin [Gemmataceae bacterium]|nr:type II toxin-antitoxin system VapC family toxin [Gemmataceae bacterium]
MARPKVYIETSFVSYLTAWPSRDVIMHGHQQVTREWWQKRRADFDLYTSQLVIREASQGDPEAVKARLDVLATMTALTLDPEADALAAELLRAGALPAKAKEDALHIALAAVYGIEYVLTWNCRHMANLAMRGKIEAVCRAAGFAPPGICTPEMLLGEAADDPRSDR